MLTQGRLEVSVGITVYKNIQKIMHQAQNNKTVFGHEVTQNHGMSMAQDSRSDMYMEVTESSVFGLQLKAQIMKERKKKSRKFGWVSDFEELKDQKHRLRFYLVWQGENYGRI